MHSRLITKYLFLAISICLSASAHSSIVNGGFENGDLNGWVLTGDGLTVTGLYGTPPVEGAYQARLSTRTGAASVANLEQSLNLSPGDLSAISTGADVFEGSALSQAFSANAGDVLSFDWNFLTEELAGAEGFQDDFAFYLLTSPTVVSSVLSSVFTVSATEFPDETGYNNTSLVIPQDGVYSFSIGVVNVLDGRFESGILVDNVQLTSVPISPPIVLFVSGVIFLLGLGKRGVGA